MVKVRDLPNMDGIPATEIVLENENWEGMEAVSVMLDNRIRNSFKFRFKATDASRLTDEQKETICFFVSESAKRKLRVGDNHTIEFCCFDLAIYRLNRWVYLFNYQKKTCCEGHKLKGHPTTQESESSSHQSA